jgi:predicted DNA-binding protein (MmcQ/YjbR family)
MTLATLRELCLSLPDTAEEIKWGQDLVFTVGKRMFCIVNTEPPNQLSFKTTPEDFAELVERPGIRPAPYLARAVWVQEEQFGETLEHQEVERLVRQAYELVRAKLPKKRVAAATAVKKAPTKSPLASRTKVGAKRSERKR